MTRRRRGGDGSSPGGTAWVERARDSDREVPEDDGSRHVGLLADRDCPIATPFFGTLSKLQLQPRKMLDDSPSHAIHETLHAHSNNMLKP